MVRSAYLVDPSEYDLNHVIYGIEEIRKVNLQRFEMEQLTAVVFEDAERQVCVGYKDLTESEFWIRGHMPGMPLMPGVIMCEAAAQLCSFSAGRYGMFTDGCVGFGGLQNVKFRGVVYPGQRFVVSAKLIKYRKDRMVVAAFQCLATPGSDKPRDIVCEGELTGIRIPPEILENIAAKTN